MRAQLAEALHVVSSDGPKLVMLLGEHGIGKTAMLRKVVVADPRERLGRL